MKKILRYFLRFFLWTLLLAFLAYCWLFFPSITGYVAKVTCSAVFVSHRNPAEVEKKDFTFPFSLAAARVDYRDSSVTASILWVARRKAVYRKGLGATLLTGLTAEQLRQQPTHLPLPPAILQDTVAWPQGDRLADTPVAGLDTSRLTAAVTAAFYDSAHKADRGTRALIVVYKGQIIAERYAPGFTQQTPLLGWSMTKGMVNALMGILVRQQQLDIHTPVPIPEWQGDDRRKITYANLMQMTSGLRFQWFPFGPCDLTNMLFKEKDMAAFAAQLPLSHKPGTIFHYSDGSANILSMLIRKRLGDKAYYRYPYEQLFYKIGMLHTVLEPDAGGTFVGSSYCYGTARDWARFGLLYLKDGVWNGERILPEGWVRWTASSSGVLNHQDFGGEYGVLWWLNIPRADLHGWRRLPDVPADYFSCQGFDGQLLAVMPSKDLVVVRLSREEGYLDPNLLLAPILKALPDPIIQSLNF